MNIDTSSFSTTDKKLYFNYLNKEAEYNEDNYYRNKQQIQATQMELIKQLLRVQCKNGICQDININ